MCNEVCPKIASTRDNSSSSRGTSSFEKASSLKRNVAEHRSNAAVRDFACSHEGPNVSMLFCMARRDGCDSCKCRSLAVQSNLRYMGICARMTTDRELHARTRVFPQT
jgi:hypothetical protein